MSLTATLAPRSTNASAMPAPMPPPPPVTSTTLPASSIAFPSDRSCDTVVANSGGERKSVRLLRHRHHCRAQQAALDHVAGLKLLDDRPRLGVGARHFQHRLVLVRVERQAPRGDAGDAMEREHL